MTLAPSSAARRPSSETCLCLALVGVTFAAFLPSCRNGFVEYDDPVYVTENPHVQAGLTRESTTWALSETNVGAWLPLAWWSLQLDVELYGLNPAGFHLTSVLLHTASVVLLFWVLRLATGVLWPSAVAAALFAVHPLRVESVAWVSERKDVLAELSWMLAMLAYVWYTRRPGVGRYLIVVAALILGLLAKPTLVTLPCAFLLLDYWPLGRLRGSTARRLILEKLPLLALIVAASLWTMTAQAEAVRTLEQFSLEIRLANALLAYVQYLGMFFWPYGLAAFYPHPRPALFSPKVLAAGTVLIGITVLAARQAKERPYLLVGWLWYLGTLVPMIGLVQVGGHGRADRYTYVPHIGLIVALVWGLAELAARAPERRPALRFTAIAAVLILTVGTWRQIDHWHDTVALWRHALDVTEDNYEAHRNLAVVLEREGEGDEALEHFQKALPIYPTQAVVYNDLGKYWMRRRRYDEAVEQFEASLRISPNDPITLNNLGSALLMQGKPDEAATRLRAAVRFLDRFAAARFNLALACAAQGRLDEAKAHFHAGRELDPDNAAAYHGFANAIRDHGAPGPAIPYFETALTLRPNDPEVHFDLALAFEMLRQFLQAIEHYRQAIRLDRGRVKYHCGLAHVYQEAGEHTAAETEYREALLIDPRWPARQDQQAWRLAVHPDAHHRRGPLAVRLAEQVCQATKYQDAGAMDTLAAAYAEVGRFDEAVSLAHRAVARATELRQTALTSEIQDRLRLYEARQPFRAQLDVRLPGAGGR